MSWTVISDGRWSFDGGEEQHILLQAGDRLVEFHHHTVHVYAAGGVVDPGYPLGAASWVSSDVRDDLTDGDDDTVWAALADSRYAAVND